MKKKLVSKIFLFISISTAIIPAFTIIACSSNTEVNTPPPSNDFPLTPIEPPITNPKPDEPTSPPSNDGHFPNEYFEHIPKDSLIPYTNGQYDLAKPGGGKKDQSIIPSGGPQKTHPSPNVEEFAKLQSSKLVNDLDINQAKKTFSMVFTDGSFGTHLGTGWILDFKLPEENENYPKTWYIATNSHVAQNLKVANDVISPERHNPEDDFYNTKELLLFGLNKFDKNVNLSDTYDSSQFNKAIIKPKNDQGQMNLKTVFIGNDFLKTSPSMFSSSPRWKDSEEYIDFAVIEVTFSSEDEAKKMTHDYYNQKETHFKYKKESLIKNPDNLKNNSFNVVGYPSIDSMSAFTTKSTIHFNKPSDKTNQFINGGRLGTSPNYQSFQNVASAFDGALGLSFFGYNYRMYNDIEPNNPTKEKFYNSWGLMYPVDYANLGPGSSGSMLMDKNGFTWGIHFAADDRASTGLAQALYSEGFNYNGLFGDYYLPGYDVIEGGFPLQKKSYRDGLITLYGNNETPFKTNLFPNGVNRK